MASVPWVGCGGVGFGKAAHTCMHVHDWVFSAIIRHQTQAVRCTGLGRTTTPNPKAHFSYVHKTHNVIFSSFCCLRIHFPPCTKVGLPLRRRSPSGPFLLSFFFQAVLSLLASLPSRKSCLYLFPGRIASSLW